jgi:hypothetical protein
MPQTQSIIVYRNPLEQQFWEGNFIIPIGGGILVFFLVMYCFMACFQMAGISEYSNAWKVITNLVLVVSACAGISVMLYLAG